LSSINTTNWKFVLEDLLKRDKIPGPVFVPLLRVAKAIGEPFDSTKLVTRQISMQEKQSPTQLMVSVGDLLDAMDKNEISLKKLLDAASKKDAEKTLTRLKEIHGQAVKVMQNPKAAQSEKMIALRLLGYGLGKDSDDHKILLALLTPQTPDDVQA